MTELSIFCDESGDGGSYEAHSPYYIVTLVFHNQAEELDDKIRAFDNTIKLLGVNGKAVHTGPLIRRENEYRNTDRSERIKIFRSILTFFRKADIRYETFVVEKRQIGDPIELRIPAACGQQFR
jgi:hypothetical protein